MPTDHKTKRWPTDHETKRYEINGVAMNYRQVGTVRAFARVGYRLAGHNHGAVVLDGRDTGGRRQRLGVNERGEILRTLGR